jgi:hypothetical protein
MQNRKIVVENPLRKICREIGCSVLSPDLCLNHPEQCGIIRKLVNPENFRTAECKKGEVK